MISPCVHHNFDINSASRIRSTVDIKSTQVRLIVEGFDMKSRRKAGFGRTKVWFQCYTPKKGTPRLSAETPWSVSSPAEFCQCRPSWATLGRIWGQSVVQVRLTWADADVGCMASWEADGYSGRGSSQACDGVQHTLATGGQGMSGRTGRRGRLGSGGTLHGGAVRGGWRPMESAALLRQRERSSRRRSQLNGSWARSS